VQLLTIPHHVQESQWVAHMKDLRDPNSSEPIFAALLGACCLYKTKICLVSAEDDQEEPIWLSAPEHWRTTEEPVEWRIPLERSPIFLGHLHESQFYAVETGAQNARNVLRAEKLEKKRRILQKADMEMRLLREGEEEEDDVDEELTISNFDKAFLEILIPPRGPGAPEPSQEAMQQEEKIRGVMKELTEEELFDLMFEYKCIFDVFDSDSSGTMRLDEIVRAFRYYGVDLQEEKSVGQGGYGVGNASALNALRMSITDGEITFTQFAQRMLAERSSIAPQTELRQLIRQLGPERSMEDGRERVKLERVQQLLANFGHDIMEGISLDELTVDQDGVAWIPTSFLEDALRGTPARNDDVAAFQHLKKGKD